MVVARYPQVKTFDERHTPKREERKTEEKSGIRYEPDGKRVILL